MLRNLPKKPGGPAEKVGAPGFLGGVSGSDPDARGSSDGVGPLLLFGVGFDGFDGAGEARDQLRYGGLGPGQDGGRNQLVVHVIHQKGERGMR